MTETSKIDLENVKARKLRVLIVAPSPDIVGGQSTQAQRLLGWFRQEQNLEVGFVPINPRLPGVLRRLQAIKFIRTFVTTLTCVLLLFREIPRHDVIHIFSAAHFSFLLAPTPAVLIAKLFGKKTILNYRSGEAEMHLKNWKIAVPLIKLFDQIVSPSEFVVDVFAKFNLPAKSIYNNLPLEKFPFRERRKLRPIILTNRLLEPLYNIDCVFKAFQIIQHQYPNAKLTVSADGDERPRLEKLAITMNLRDVRFTGFVTNAEMAELYCEADIYMISPNADNMPGSVIECYASGLPIVSTGVGGIPYIVKHNETGLLVEKNDHEDLARQAMRLLEDDELAQKIIHNGRAESLKYDWEQVREKWLGLYSSLVKTK